MAKSDKEIEITAVIKVTVEGFEFTLTEKGTVKVLDSDVLVVNASVESAPTMMAVGETLRLVVTVDTGTVEDIKWTCSSDAVKISRPENETADVIEAVKAGQVTVTAEVTAKKDGKTAIDTVKFTVNVIEKPDLQDDTQFWSQYADVVKNKDGSVTCSYKPGSEGWQTGEFGFVIPRDLVGKVTKVVIKYKDADLTAKGEKACGYVFHYGDEEKVSWIDGEDNWPKSLEICGEGEIVLENTDPDKDISTVRIYGGAREGHMTIVSLTYRTE